MTQALELLPYMPGRCWLQAWEARLGNQRFCGVGKSRVVDVVLSEEG